MSSVLKNFHKKKLMCKFYFYAWHLKFNSNNILNLVTFSLNQELHGPSLITNHISIKNMWHNIDFKDFITKIFKVKTKSLISSLSFLGAHVEATAAI